MKTKLILILFILLIFTKANSQNIPEYVPGEAIIRISTNTYQGLVYESPKTPYVTTNKAELNSLFSELGITKIKRLFPLEENTQFGIQTGINRSFVVYFSREKDVMETINLLQLSTAIEYAYPNYIYTTFMIPNDPFYNQQWSLPKIKMPEAWAIQRGNNNIKIAVVDAGFNLSHPDLIDKFTIIRRDEVDTELPRSGFLGQVPGEDYWDVDDDPTGYGGHADHVAGIAAASTNNNIGIAGVGWDIKIVPVRAGYAYFVFNRIIGILQLDDVLRAYNWVKNFSGARVLNCSFGRSYTGGPLNDEQTMIEALIDAGIVICASSGNSNDSVGYPAAYPGVIAVGATKQNDYRTTPQDWGEGRGSNFGSKLSIVAPGHDIYSTFGTCIQVVCRDPIETTPYEPICTTIVYFCNSYRNISGTSMAAPHVSGAVALILSQKSSLTPAEVKQIIESSADKVPGMWGQNFHIEYGYGRLNVYNALLKTQLKFQFVNSIQNNEDYGQLVIDNDKLNLIPSGTFKSFSFNSEHNVRTNELPFIVNFKNTGTTQKFHRWYEDESDYNLVHNFVVTPLSRTKIPAKFLKTEPAEIKIELIEEPSISFGNIKFLDPWHYYKDLNDDWVQPNEFISYPSPLKINNNNINSYGGVFLNQGGPDPNNLTPPYYSVRVPIYQWIGNFYSQFEEWQATGATLREIYDLNVPGYSTRAVVFKSSDAKVTAKYCAITASLDAQIMSGWNLVSIPINIASTPASQIYPDATSYVFGFENGTYVPKSTLKSGEGYWVRFANAHTKNYSGQPMFSTTIPVKSGWNLVGSISIPISINKTRTEPEGKRISPFYKHSSGGYVVADTIKPGEGYWVKMQSDCNLLYNIAPPQQGPGYEDPIIADVLNNSDRFIVSDAEGNTQELYVYTGEANLEGLDLELPPAPPEGAIFNVRFATDRMIEVYDETAEENNFIIEVNTENYPVTVEWEINSENGIEYTVGYSSGGYGKTNYRQLDEKNGKIILPTKGNERISLLTGKVKSRVVPKEYSLKQNRPNPFNPITSINFALPVAGHTTLKIYDVLGREVAVLVNEYKEAGVYEVVWDASAQPSGVYFYKLQSGNFIAVKKMLLVR